MLVRFGDPVHAGEKDFTADVICAIDNANGHGVYIAKMPGWSRSHPEAHTRMVREAIDSSRVAFAHDVRLLKHWNRSNGKPLVSWNIKALALACITRPTTQLAGLASWFTYAADQLDKGLTEDPAHVAEKPIKLGKGWTQTQVVTALREAGKRLDEATRLERDGYPLQAHEQLAKLFNDDEMLPHPDPAAVRDEAVRRWKEQSLGGTNAGVGQGAARPQVQARSWAP